MKILVVGDSMEDRRLDSEVCRISQEAPIPIYDINSATSYAGGAANVALNIKAMGGDVTLLTPQPTATVVQMLRDAGIDAATTPAASGTRKTRIFTDGGVMRVRFDEDYILDPDESSEVLDRFVDLLPQHHMVVFSDYGKGALQHVGDMLEHARHKLTIVDPKGSWKKYQHADIIKGNYSEVPSTRAERMQLLIDLNLLTIIQTAGAAGSTATTHLHPVDVVVKGLDIVCRDPTGAGDSYLAALAVALSVGVDLPNAMRRASAAGGVAVFHVGTKIVTAEEIDKWLRLL